ncbi:MFS general substrate transporter [Aspergillus neoniger CBS 115656]|uniref:MFS general substrate transporter n=1 Tax=Aspergillus neoniger (strain CBS 115656) TaxID=1448310 RepID=A0A318Y6J7_ASPNB|nr:MFS general substrate transporter [Aspergillus neoniger CBS 115656]PYH28370.1 MFS general substrate transporter [Aspergillus neoniger CBS 115656]
MNLIFTLYMIIQAISPTIIVMFSDVTGQRPAYFFCFIVFIAANIGLALQSNYIVLLIFYYLQSAGSSATGALVNMVITDTVTSAERGSYIRYIFSISSLSLFVSVFVGQPVSPVLGGILVYTVSWQWIFWFLAIFSGPFFIIFVLFNSETCRKIVGNGLFALPLSRIFPQPGANFSILLLSLKIYLLKEEGAILLYSGLIFASLAAVAAALSSHLSAQFKLNELQIGLCCIPMGVGSCGAVAVMEKLVNFNYHRHARLKGIITDSHNDTDLHGFPIEAARLQVALPVLYLNCTLLVCYGWILQKAHSLGATLTFLFFLSFTATATFGVLSTLLIDLLSDKPGAAGAANNLTRCLLGAGSAAFILPLIQRTGVGWAYTVIAGLLTILSPIVWVILIYGQQWRRASQNS